MAKFDTREIRRDNPLDKVVSERGIKLRKDGREWRALCPFHSEKTESFTIFPGRDKDLRYNCFGCGAHGDVIDFVIEYYGLDPKKDFNKACEILGGSRKAPDTKPKLPPAESFDPYADYKILFPPIDQPQFAAGKSTGPILNPKRIERDGKPAFVTYSKPKSVHPYRDAEGKLRGYVLRIEFEDRKITPCILWARNTKTGYVGWIHGSMPEPRPPYRADALHDEPDKQVLIVEGEKCADEGAETLSKVVTISWLGGTNAVEKTNWRHLKGRRVVLWMDNDDEGEAAMLGKYDRQGEWRRGLAEIAIAEGASTVKVISRPGEDKPKGWDIADAVHEDGMTEQQIYEWAASHTIEWSQAKTTGRKQSLRDPVPRDPREPNHPDRDPPAEETTTAKITRQQEKPAPANTASVPAVRPRRDNVISLHGSPIPQPEVDDDWRKNLIFNEENKLRPRLNTNFKWMLRGHEKIRGVFAWNEIARDIFVVKQPPWARVKSEWQERKITDDDITECVGFLERQHLTPKPSEVVAALAVVSKDYSYNPVQHYLKHLEWDKRPRLLGNGRDVLPFVCEYFGIPPQGPSTSLYASFFTRWMVSAVARALHPGCKADCALVLEGTQGLLKSTLLSVLATVNGVAYYTDDVRDIESKDAALTMQGCWIVEIPELDAFRRKEADSIKSWLSRSKDRFRPPYQKMVADFPRQSVIAGTMNPSGHGYLRDPTGARRFWPVPVNAKIDIDRVIEERDQLWAEAVQYYRERMKWYLTDEEAKQASKVTEERYEEDPWTSAIDDLLIGLREVTVEKIITHLAIPRAQQTAITVKRITEYLRRIGYKKRRKRSTLTGKQPMVWVRGDDNEIDPSSSGSDDDDGI